MPVAIGGILPAASARSSRQRAVFVRMFGSSCRCLESEVLYVRSLEDGHEDDNAFRIFVSVYSVGVHVSKLSFMNMKKTIGNVLLHQ